MRLPTNFKSARFPSDAHTAILKKLEADIEAARFDKIELPVKLKVHESVFVPLAKWAMLIAGNYRCVTKEGPRAIKDAVHSDINASRAVYNWVVNLCLLLGAKESDLVPFDKYAAAAQNLGSPSSAARALYGGAPYIERSTAWCRRSQRRRACACPPRRGRRAVDAKRGEPQESRVENRGQSPISGIHRSRPGKSGSDPDFRPRSRAPGSSG